MRTENESAGRGKNLCLVQLWDQATAHTGTKIMCTREAGHPANHRAATCYGEYEWWNDRDNPQRA